MQKIIGWRNEMQIRGVTFALALINLVGVQAANCQPFSFEKYNIADGRSTAFPITNSDTPLLINLNVPPAQIATFSTRSANPNFSEAGYASNLKNLIAWAEAGRRGYDAVQHGARQRPSDLPTRMTIDQIYQWIDATPGQPHAIGRYQFIPPTLRNLVQEAGLPRDTVFTSEVQDRLADILLEDAGMSAFVNGDISRHRFMENLAKIWAGLPTSTGRSYYHGYAGNHATISWSEFDRNMIKIFFN